MKWLLTMTDVTYYLGNDLSSYLSYKSLPLAPSILAMGARQISWPVSRFWMRENAHF